MTMASQGNKIYATIHKRLENFERDEARFHISEEFIT